MFATTDDAKICAELKKDFQATDTDGDGQLTLDEHCAYREKTHPNAPPPDVFCEKVVKPQFEQVDTDHNGKLSWKEVVDDPGHPTKCPNE